ncbi:MAG: translation initiation factor IF-2 subunit beta [Methanomassiliicoccales archaeon]
MPETVQLDYEKLLKRAKSAIPEAISTGERFQLPEPDLVVEGKGSVLRNFTDFAERLRREPEHLLQYLLRELGTPGTLEGRRVVFKSRVNTQQLMERIWDYTGTYVICSECGRPDTKLVREGRVSFIECEACGAKRPVIPRKTAAPQQSQRVKEGAILEVDIDDVGSKGDGIAHLDNFIIYVQGAIRGSRVTIRVNKVAGTIAFATVTG